MFVTFHFAFHAHHGWVGVRPTWPISWDEGLRRSS